MDQIEQEGEIDPALLYHEVLPEPDGNMKEVEEKENEGKAKENYEVEIKVEDQAEEKEVDDKSAHYCSGYMSQKTLLQLWGTILVTVFNFAYFTAGYYAFKHFNDQYNVQQQVRIRDLLEERQTLMNKYPFLQSNTTKLEIYTGSAELLCYITENPRPQWNFYTAFDFCVTIITTVGYGVLVPTTWFSKLLCCCYAMVGLPLYIVMLGAAGKYINSMFDYLNKKSEVVKQICTHKYIELIIAYVNIAIVMGLFLVGCSIFGHSTSRQQDRIKNTTTVISLPGYNFNNTAMSISIPPENWTWTEAVYYSMISLTTVGFGDYHLSRFRNLKQAAVLFASISFGFALFSYALQTYSKASEGTINYIKKKTQAIGQSTARVVHAEVKEIMVYSNLHNSENDHLKEL